MTRDSQIGKVYVAVHAAGTRFPQQTPDEVAAAIIKVMNSAWFQKRWAAVGRPVLVKKITFRTMQSSTYCEPMIHVMKQRANAKRTPHEVEVRVAPGQTTLIQVLHIITHYLRPGWNHDQAFCKEFLAVVGRFMGADAKKIMTETFREHRVKVRVYSDEARLAARHRLIARDSIPDLVALRDELAGS